MTLKQALRFIVHLFFVVTALQIIVIVLFSAYITGNDSGVGMSRLIEVLTLSIAITLPVFILVPSTQEPSERELIIRYIAHFIVSAAVMVVYWIFTWSFTRNNIILVSATYTAIYFGAHIVWYRYRVGVKLRMREVEAHARSEAKGRFLAHMSHEIRTPILSVLGIAEIQFHKNTDHAETQAAFLQIHNAANTLTDILNSILDLSKIEEGKMEINAKAFDVALFIQESTQLHAALLETKNFKFNLKVDESMPTNLIGDELRIRQVINNLLSNSFKYTDVGMVRMEIRCEQSEQENHVNMIVAIRDTGCGMTEEQVNILQTDEYIRFAEKKNPHVQGTGLGISIVQKMIALMGATFTISSKVGVGTKITVSIPLEMASDAAIGIEIAERLERLETISKPLLYAESPMPNAKVLVVDDIETNLYVISGLLELYKMEVETCDNAIDAIEKIKNGKVYDLIFMDYMMPEMDGIEAVRTIREMGYTKPIIVLSANAFKEQEAEFIENGFDDFLAKPIKTETLYELLMQYIK